MFSQCQVHNGKTCWLAIGKQAEQVQNGFFCLCHDIFASLSYIQIGFAGVDNVEQFCVKIYIITLVTLDIC